MGRRNRNVPVVPDAEGALDRVKYEVADDLGLLDKVKQVGWENMTTREVGKIGGNMVRRLIGEAEKSMAKNQ